MNSKSSSQIKKLQQKNEIKNTQIKEDQKLVKKTKDLEIKRMKQQEIALNKSLGINIKPHSIDFSQTCININNSDKQQLNGLMKNQQNTAYTKFSNYSEFNNVLIPSQKGLKGFYQVKQDYQNEINPLYKKTDNNLNVKSMNAEVSVPSNINKKQLNELQSEVFKFQLKDNQWTQLNLAPQSNIKRMVPNEEPNYQVPFNKKNKYPLTVKPATYSYENLPQQLQNYLRQTQNYNSNDQSVDSIQYKHEINDEMQNFRQNSKKHLKGGQFVSSRSANNFFGGKFFNNAGFNFRTQEQMVDLSHIMYAANFDSAMTSHIKKSSTFGRSNDELLKISAFMDRNNYLKKIKKDKLNNIRPEIRLKMLDPERAPADPLPGKLQSRKFSLEMLKNFHFLNKNQEEVKQGQILHEYFLKSEKEYYEKQNIRNNKNLNQEQTKNSNQNSNFFSTQPNFKLRTNLENQESQENQMNIDENEEQKALKENSQQNQQLKGFQNQKLKNQKIYSSVQGFKPYQEGNLDYNITERNNSNQNEAFDIENNKEKSQNSNQVQLHSKSVGKFINLKNKDSDNFSSTLGKNNSQLQTWYQTQNEKNFQKTLSRTAQSCKSSMNLNRVTIGDGVWQHGKNEPGPQKFGEEDFQAKKLEEPKVLKYQKDRYYREQEGVKFSENYKNAMKLKYQKQLKEPLNKRAGLMLNFIQKQNHVKRNNIYRSKKMQQLNVVKKMSENEFMYSALYYNKNKMDQITKSLENDYREAYVQENYENDYYSYV